MKNKKKDVKVEHILHDDCRTCVRDVLKESPFVKDLYDSKSFKLVSLRGSLPYLIEMTKVIGEHLIEASNNDNEKVIFSDYISDIQTMLLMFNNMKNDV